MGETILLVNQLILDELLATALPTLTLVPSNISEDTLMLRIFILVVNECV